ncbi:hypothetical protein NKH18_29080 [Streptomyces sp. M10(2022)]
MLTGLNIVGGYFVLLALMTESEGPWDSTVTETVRLEAGLGAATASSRRAPPLCSSGQGCCGAGGTRRLSRLR